MYRTGKGASSFEESKDLTIPKRFTVGFPARVAYTFGIMEETLGHQKFERWKRENELSSKAISVATGLTEMQVSHILNRRRRASFEAAFSIAKASGYFIEPEDWLRPPVEDGDDGE